ncbi:galactokinase [Agriterribacter sp.]|uniref:galactokinase n=1 Tax=Agriterribacter sp. TaxID=2821509 RepID=UPI002B6310DB|nr:galactokinase [Agriterribacter sp.]HRO44348.1 galactokinase [Agriterribacter sp.]HRQ16664.1 galactokinase [Agriterribacter sp.]
MTSGNYDTALLNENFRQRFHAVPMLFRSPGRINIIGEHTDYNDGFVLPAAIDKAAYVAISKRDDDSIELASLAFNETYTSKISEVRPLKSWTDYVLGVVDQLSKQGFAIGGFNLALDGDIIIGAGLSSSAAVECSVLYALNELFALGLSKIQIAKMAQAAEHEFAGVKCGIMDQFASVFGKAAHAIQLDCRSLEYQYVPLHMEEIKIVLFNSNVSHALASSGYNTRRQQCEQGVAWVREQVAEVQSLRDVSHEMLQQHVLPKDELIYRRCKYVLEENLRLLAACDDLKKGDIAALGQKMFRTHEGLSKEYEVSCSELDWLVQYVRNEKDVLGARMMGGGFGGCSINLVKEEAVDALVEKVSAQYRQATGLTLSAYAVQIADGTEEILQPGEKSAVECL